MSRLAIIGACLAIAGCAHDGAPATIETSVSGPKFPASQFDCGSRPVPPNVAAPTGRTAAKFENRLGAWGQGCSDRLQSTGRELDAAGQIVR
jgi:hypothetical protein